MGQSRIKISFHACFQSFTICETLKTQVKLNLNFTSSQCDYLLILCRAKFIKNIIRYKRELCFECELQV